MSIAILENNQISQYFVALIVSNNARIFTGARTKCTAGITTKKLEKEAASLAIRWTQQLNLNQVKFESGNLKVLEALGDRISKTKSKPTWLLDSSKSEFQLCMEGIRTLELIPTFENFFTTKLGAFCLVGDVSRSWAGSEILPILLDLMNFQGNYNYNM
ncbi:hypothetical protein MKX01_014112 [Papaver californicum]|nr:hypothetical protein MKX01_014112 [Papaver californicum]